MKSIIKYSLICLLVTAVAVGALLGYKLYSEREDGLCATFERTTIVRDSTRVIPPDTLVTVNGVNFKMISIPGGDIASKGRKDTLTLYNFFISETEVTQELWEAVMGNNPSAHQGDPQLPVECVDMQACIDFVEKLSKLAGKKFFLPGLEQWEYAAHLGNENDDVIYCGSNELEELGWYEDNSGGQTHPVKQKRPNALGLYDMSGNVAEWTSPVCDPFAATPGGGYNKESSYCGTDVKEYCHYNVADGNLGLRIVYYNANMLK